MQTLETGMSNLNELAATLRLPAEPLRTPMFIDGKDYAGSTGEFVERKSPGHGVPVTATVRASVDDLNAAVACARRAFDDGRWSRLSGEQRATVLLKPRV
jgi:acyl-CoA reductase-like NAD-dependent aldehyde dehydrogenase